MPVVHLCPTFWQLAGPPDGPFEKLLCQSAQKAVGSNPVVPQPTACGCEQLLVPQRRDGAVWSVPLAWWMLTFHLLTQQLFLTHPCVPCDLTDKHRAEFVSSVGPKWPGMWCNFYIKPHCIWVIIFAGQKPPAVWLYCGIINCACLKLHFI